MRTATAATPARLQGAAGRTLSPLTAVVAAAAVPNGRMAARATHAAPQPLNKPTPGNGRRNGGWGLRCLGLTGLAMS